MYTEKEFESIHRLAAEMKDDCVKFIQDLIRIPSISGNEKSVADRIIEELNKLGYDKVIRDKYGNVIGMIFADGESSSAERPVADRKSVV